MDRAGLALYRSGDRLSAISAWQRALSIDKKLLDHCAGFGADGKHQHSTTEESVKSRIRILINLTTATRETNHFDDGLAHGQSAFDLAIENKFHKLAATAALNCSDICISQESFDQASEWIQKSENAVSPLNDPKLLVKIGRRRGEIATLLDMPDALETVDNLIGEATSAGMLRDLSRLVALRAV